MAGAPRHIWVAFAAAPVVALLALTAAIAVSLMIETGATAIIVRGLPMSTLFVLLVGLPVAYVVELAIGVPLYRRRHALGWLRRWHVIAASTLVSTVVLPVVWALLVGNPVVWPMALYGAFMGLVAGGTFVLIARPDGVLPPRA